MRPGRGRFSSRGGPRPLLHRFALLDKLSIAEVDLHQVTWCSKISALIAALFEKL